MLDDSFPDALNDAVNHETDHSFADFETLFSEPSAFDTVDPSMTLTAPSSALQNRFNFSNDLFSGFDYSGAQSGPCTPLPYQHNASVRSDFPSPANLGRRRSQSQPPEAVTFQRSSGHFIGRPSSLKNPYPQAQPSPGRSGDLKWRQHPYPRPGPNKPRSRPRETSKPTPLHLTDSMAALRGPAMPDQYQMTRSGFVDHTGPPKASGLSHNPPGLWRSHPQHEPMTALLGISSRLDLFKRDFEDMKELIRKEFAELRKHTAQPTETYVNLLWPQRLVLDCSARQRLLTLLMFQQAANQSAQC